LTVRSTATCAVGPYFETASASVTASISNVTGSGPHRGHDLRFTDVNRLAADVGLAISADRFQRANRADLAVRVNLFAPERGGIHLRVAGSGRSAMAHVHPGLSLLQDTVSKGRRSASPGPGPAPRSNTIERSLLSEAAIYRTDSEHA